MNKIKVFLTFLLVSTIAEVMGQTTTVPTIDPTIVVLNTSVGDSIIGEQEYTGQAPLSIRFVPCAENAEGWDANYEWRIHKGNRDISTGNVTYDSIPTYKRFEEETEMTFSESTSFMILLYATFQKGSQRVEYTKEWWSDEENKKAKACYIHIQTSILKFPNAFSPNNDGTNDIFKAKKGHRSIIEFHAYIYNRWGQKIYDWTDINAGWDGTQNGKPVKDGVYFLYCKAKGADGVKYNIKQDVNILRGFNEASVNP